MERYARFERCSDGCRSRRAPFTFPFDSCKGYLVPGICRRRSGHAPRASQARVPTHSAPGVRRGHCRGARVSARWPAGDGLFFRVRGKTKPFRYARNSSGKPEVVSEPAVGAAPPSSAGTPIWFVRIPAHRVLHGAGRNRSPPRRCGDDARANPHTTRPPRRSPGSVRSDGRRRQGDGPGGASRPLVISSAMRSGVTVVPTAAGGGDKRSSAWGSCWTSDSTSGLRGRFTVGSFMCGLR